MVALVGFPKTLADELFHSPKRLVHTRRWVLKTNDTGRETGRELECLVEIDGVIWRGAILRIAISAGNLDKCTMSLLARHGEERTRHRLNALDLNPTCPHRNPLRGPAHLIGKRFRPGDTHEHLYLDNVDHAGELHDRCDAVARQIVDAPTTFQEGLRYIRARLKLLNADDIPPPETQGDLL